MRDSRASAVLLWIAGAPLFCVLAIANAAGYRYGVSDLAFYLPAGLQRAGLASFPRDGALLDVQSRLTLADDVMGLAMRGGAIAGIETPAIVYALHVASLLLLFVAAVALGRAVFRSGWSVVALAAALTLRHAVARAGVNTLEGYFHPRIFAFGLGVLAVAVFLRRGIWPALVIGLLAAAVHTTTAFWFLVCLGVAGLISERRDRLPLLACGTLATGMLGYAIARGPLAGRLAPMDAAWLSVIAEKDYLFPDRWPLSGWLVPAAYVAVVAAAACVRRRAGELRPRERALLGGAAALVVIFVMLLPPMLVRSALAIQMQPSRVFWILDLFATLSVIWLLGDARGRHRTLAPAIVAVVVVLGSAARGVYLMAVRFPERSLAVLSPPDTPWEDAMRWARSTERGSHWLAHPDHAYLYGSGVRVSGRRDVFLERSKDPAIAMYDRGVAMRVQERLPLVSDFDDLSAPRVLDLARRYDLDFLITEVPLPLPLAYRNARFNIYRLR